MRMVTRTLANDVNPDGVGRRPNTKGGITMPRSSEHTIHVTERNFDEALMAAQGLVMVDFWAEWCGPCQAIAPVLDKVVDGSDGRVTLMKVNVDENPDLTLRYAVRSIPTILFVKDGTVVDRVIGAVPEASIQAIVRARV